MKRLNESSALWGSLIALLLGTGWTNASSQVRRSIIMDDDVLSVSDREIQLNSSTDLGVDVARVALRLASSP